MKDHKALDQAVIAAAADKRSAEKDHKLASAQIQPAATLDASLAAGHRFVVDLEELGRLTTDNQFIRHIIDTRQRNLLAVASQLLGAMSNDQFGFAPDFQVVHRITNQPRPRGTLSGGETFLASLALALALVEIAARAGGKLDALFLDEGFGTLDASSLDEAMSVLESRAEAGRLVVVVSHIKAVAERIPTVLHITKTAAGSRAEFVTDDERGKLVEAELEEHLLG
jgi:exonuclease SbcC